MAPVGIALQPDERFLELLGAVVREDVDYYEVAPETLWRVEGDGSIGPNGFHRRFAALGDETGCFFVAHGVGLSIGGMDPSDVPRRRAWHRRIAADQKRFRFRWYTDHLGVSSPAGLALTLPLPVPMTTHAAAVVRRRLDALARIVPHVGVENTVQYFMLGDPLDEPAFLRRILGADPKKHLLLDLHNVHTMAENFGFDPADYLGRLDLQRVIEIHLSGGADSDPSWLPNGRTMRLDSHDGAVPEAVWRLYEATAPRCPHLRGVTLERMEGTVGVDDVPLLREELRRVRRVVQ